MSNIEVTPEESLKLAMLLTIVVETSGAKHRFIKILTNSSFVREFVSGRDDFDGIEVTNNLEQAMDGLLGRKAGSFIDNETNVVHQDFLQSAEPKKEKEESFNLRFESESSNAFSLKDLEGNLSIAVVDDDFVIQEMIKTAFSDMNVEIRSYENGRQFIEDKSAFQSDLVFLDLMMPEMNVPGAELHKPAEHRDSHHRPLCVIQEGNGDQGAQVRREELHDQATQTRVDS
jgi:CheY-like chemotaxis protein